MRYGFIATILLAFSAPLAAEPLSFLNTNNGRAAIDFSSRAILNENDNGVVLALGLDTHRVFTSDKGDLATLTLQPYLVVADSSPGLQTSDPEVSSQKTFIDWRTSNLNVKLASRGALNLRIGHFEIPFGLEHVIQNNGQLNTFNARFNTGRRTDWGATFNGLAHNVEYELGWVTGPASSKGFWAGRIGRSRTKDLWYGVSGVIGDTNAPARDASVTVERSRVALDVGANFMSGIHVLAELAAGRDNGERVTHAFVETGYRNPSETHIIYAQFRVSRFNDPQVNLDTDSLTLGYRFEPSSSLTASVEYRYCLQSTLEPSQLTAQLRLRI